MEPGDEVPDPPGCALTCEEGDDEFLPEWMLRKGKLHKKMEPIVVGQPDKAGVAGEDALEEGLKVISHRGEG